MRRTRFSYRWCVKGAPGLVTAVFASRSPRARAALVTTTASTHGSRGVRPTAAVSLLRRAYPRRRRIASGVYRAGPRSSRLIGVRRGRVRFIGVAGRRVLRRPRSVRRQLARAGIRR